MITDGLIKVMSVLREARRYQGQGQMITPHYICGM